MIYYNAVWAFLPFGFERKNGMIVLGIDPGYAIVGYGVVEMKNNRYRTLEHGAVTTKAGTDFNRRLEIIYDGIAQVLAQYHPDAISVEKLYFSNNKTTGIGVAEARGVILLAAQKARVPVFEYTPVQVKLAVTGYGKALKPQVMEMTRRLLNLKSVPQPDDAADALAIAICHGHNGGSRLPTAALAEIRGGNRRGKPITYKEKKT